MRGQVSTMVQVVIQMRDDAKEWGLVELQGQLETREQVAFDNMHIGDLHFDEKGVHLIVGHHLLTGKVVELDRPYAILKKISEKDANEDEVQTERLQTSDSMKGTEYEVVALIFKKILFKNRPKPIITKKSVKKIF